MWGSTQSRGGSTHMRVGEWEWRNKEKGVLIKFFPNQVLLLPENRVFAFQFERKTLIIARKYYPNLKRSYF